MEASESMLNIELQLAVVRLRGKVKETDDSRRTKSLCTFSAHPQLRTHLTPTWSSVLPTLGPPHSPQTHAPLAWHVQLGSPVSDQKDGPEMRFTCPGSGLAAICAENSRVLGTWSSRRSWPTRSSVHGQEHGLRRTRGAQAPGRAV